jgi:hypothetical protein
MRAFIIRPFGTKNDINFDDVEQKLIAPALSRLQIPGCTTMKIRRQGNIRLDMFQHLLTSDLVIADISIHNANVYYELGVRHALRGKHTFMIRARGTDLKTDDVPFDIKTDRYLNYDGVNPQTNVDDLYEGLRQTINSDAKDSPVFQILPNLDEQDRAKFLPVPRDFREEVERATQMKELGDLELLAAEARGFAWEIEGIRLVGRAQFDLKGWEGARATWEAVLRQDHLDLQANKLLGTIYQRLDDLTGSDQALKRVLSRPGLTKKDRAETGSLLGRNAKAHWSEEWRQSTSLPDRQRRALVSAYLDESLEAYDAAFKEDLNHFYAGLNSLAMLTFQTQLAELMPEVWAEKFDDEEAAQRELDSRKKQVQKLSAATDLSLKAAAAGLQKEQSRDPGEQSREHYWVEISEAYHCFLTSDRPTKVASVYRRALVGAPDFISDAVRRQLSLHQDLGLRRENVDEVVRVLGPAPEVGSAPRVLLFTGHMLDAPGREPRFPRAKVEIAKQKIAEAVAAEQQVAGEIAYGLAGCSGGGDILFHQVCDEMNIPTRIFLAVRRSLYIRESVAHAGPEWIDEFNRLVRTRTVRVLCESTELPRWLQDKPNYNIWQRNNLWILHNALAAAGGENVTLIALWNGASGDGAGGTADMVRKAQERGAKTIILDTNKIF